MKTLMTKLIFGTVCALTLASANPTHAIAINVLGAGDFPARDISNITGNPGLGDANVLFFLEAVASNNGFPAPTTTVTDYNGGSIEAGDYLVLHYGSGPGGTSAGGLVVLYFDASQGTFDVPSNGSGPNGNGGISFARLYDHGGQEVPDGGGTGGLFCLGMAGLAFASRKTTA